MFDKKIREKVIKKMHQVPEVKIPERKINSKERGNVIQVEKKI